jgi:hypothetical protein
MASANCKITAELISDYATGRLDVEEVAAAVAAARRVDARMTTALAASMLGVPRPRLGSSPAGPSA